MTDISIIVPIYNAEKHLQKCIDSLLNQTKQELELILVNDGSTDNTETIIKNYQDKRIKYYKNKNQGIGKTRNFGITKATGKYIMFIDSDDYLEKTACEDLYQKATKEKLEVVVCDYYIVEENKAIEEKLISFESTSLKNRPEIIEEVNLSPWNKLYKTSLIKNKQIKFVENLKYEDAPFVLEALDKAQRIGKVDKCLNYYVIHDNSETTIRDERIFDIIKIVDKIRKYFEKKSFATEAVNKLTVKILTNYTIQQRVNINKKAGMRFIDEAFTYLKENVPDYKDNKYYEKRSKTKRMIEKSKFLTKIYCRIYQILKHTF